MSRADMESASPRRHTLQAAVLKPEELSALSCVGGTRLAMMVDQTRRKGRGDGGEEASLFLIGRQTLASLSGGQGKALSACLSGQPGRFVKRRMVAQRGVADARELVGQGAGGLVVVAAGLEIERPAADAAVMEQAKACGATIVKQAQDTFWGGYGGYFQDPDGHLWEIVWNPQWEVEGEA